MMTTVSSPSSLPLTQSRYNHLISHCLILFSLSVSFSQIHFKQLNQQFLVAIVIEGDVSETFVLLKVFFVQSEHAVFLHVAVFLTHASQIGANHWSTTETHTHIYSTQGTQRHQQITTEKSGTTQPEIYFTPFNTQPQQHKPCTFIHSLTTEN